jgi:1-acyl-sn-glycerol-3-phosphate acyltransferase
MSAEIPSLKFVVAYASRRFKPLRDVAFVLTKPRQPKDLPRHEVKSRLGADYDTTWARSPIARVVRRCMIEGITRPVVKTIASPRVIGADRLSDTRSPLIFALNHSSHLDTSLTITALPAHVRHSTAVAARSDYFFDKHWKAALWSLWMNVIPLERDKVNRQSIETAEEVLSAGWSLVIFPEGTRGDDDFTLPFRPGAAYLSMRTGVPVVPIHLEGTRNIFTPYTRRLRFGHTRVTFGAPMLALEGERSREFNERIEQAVAVAADEGRTDWWSARRRAADGTTPLLRGPEGMSGWRRSWTGTGHAARNQTRRWPR